MARNEHLKAYYDNKKLFSFNWDRAIKDIREDINERIETEPGKEDEKLERLKWDVLGQKMKYNSNFMNSVYMLLFALIPICFALIFQLTDPSRSSAESEKYLIILLSISIVFVICSYIAVRFDMTGCNIKERLLEIKLNIINEELSKRDKLKTLELCNKQKNERLNIILRNVNKKPLTKKFFSIKWWQK